MAILTLSIEDIGSGLIRVQVKSDTDVDNSPITPAMAVMATILEQLQDVAASLEQQQMGKVH